MSIETIILLALIVAATLFVGRFLFAILTVIALGFLIVIGLAIASDLMTGSNALEQIADQLAPVVAGWLASFSVWLKSRLSK